ncbi:hypothetical protein RB2344 [Rhodopirellula baltica SH 1]|uniref:Uncharacterized protein n=1 Tax=Rhodopirellula baltica (strain DSM 10527 / NCIMB 13988 / SH1) TaxID=243090 RepID=Q7UW01_RHOBA|nr:hypothetical protein RB2344 [Rhodopirellula baltica SH 1]
MPLVKSFGRVETEHLRSDNNSGNQRSGGVAETVIMPKATRRSGSTLPPVHCNRYSPIGSTCVVSASRCDRQIVARRGIVRANRSSGFG